MKDLILKCMCIITILCVISAADIYADQWDDMVKDAYKQMPSKSKRKLSSGKRLIAEKGARIREIDTQLPELMRAGEYMQAEGLLKEALKLQIEILGTTDDLKVAERFTVLGFLYFEMDDMSNAAAVLTRAKSIGENVIGSPDISLVNIYRLLAEVYRRQGRSDMARNEAFTYFNLIIGKFGNNSPQAEEAKTFLQGLYKGTA